MDNPTARIEVQTDAGALATAVAGELLSRIADAQASGAVPAICLTGGSIADAVHAEIGRLGADSGVDWTAVDFWWGDERYVDLDSPDRLSTAARAAFLDPLGVPEARIHEVPTPSPDRTMDEAARAYGEELRAAPQHEFLVAMFGIGPDGHVASLFPGFPQLHEHDEIAVAVTGSPKPPPERISLTFDALNHAAATWFLVSGESKADAVRRALADEGSVEDTPARGLRGTPETTWFLDQAAASQI